MDKNKLKQIVGDEWFSLLSNVLSPEVSFEIDAVREQYMQGKLIYPTSDKTWRAFELTPLKDLKVVWLGQDPYPNGQATGLAFEVSPAFPITPSFDAILGAFNDCHPSHFNTSIMSGYITPWAKQGVLLLNTALTVEARKPNSHQVYWNKFTVELIKELSNYDNEIIFIGLGKEAEKLLNDTTNEKIILEHPAYAARNNRKWEHKNFFLTINEYLNKLNKTIINWDYE
jgi:uracil-DNA glycosylase